MTRRRLFVHFLDHWHSDRAIRLHKIPFEVVLREALFAFRISWLFFDELIIPASTYYESPLAHQILELHPLMAELGLLLVSASEESLGDHRAAKEAQYNDPSLSPLYHAYRSSAPKLTQPAYIQKRHSSLRAIQENWIDLIGSSRFPVLLNPTGERRLPKNADTLWSRVPGELGNDAFVIDHVAPLLSRLGLRGVPRLSLEGAIEPPYIGGYSDSLNAQLCNTLVYLESPFEIPNRLGSFAFKDIAILLTSLGLNKALLNAQEQNILLTKATQAWLSFERRVRAGARLNTSLLRLSREVEKSLSLSLPKLAGWRHNTVSNEIKFGIVTALPVEFAAVKIFLADIQDEPAPGDSYKYISGNIIDPRTNTPTDLRVVVQLMKRTGTNSCAVATTNMIRSFPSLKGILLSGIACAIPKPKKPQGHVRLGDIVVADRKGVIQYDHFAQKSGKKELRDVTPPPSPKFIQALNHLQADLFSDDPIWIQSVRFLPQPSSRSEKFERPDASTDIVLDENGIVVEHPIDPDRVPDLPRLFPGAIGSANILMRDFAVRDQLSEDYGILAIEMEGSGLAEAGWSEEVGYMVVRGMADYGDDRTKSDLWHPYASRVAAATSVAILLSTKNDQNKD